MQISFAGTRRNKGDMKAVKAMARCTTGEWHQERQERMQKSMPQVEAWHGLAEYSLCRLALYQNLI